MYYERCGKHCDPIEEQRLYSLLQHMIRNQHIAAKMAQKAQTGRKKSCIINDMETGGQRMKEHLKSIPVTIVLLLLLLIVVFSEIAIYISGPSRKYEDSVAKQEQKIKDAYGSVKELHRHVFQYTVYVGEDEQLYIWFNEEGNVVTTKEKSSARFSEAKRIAQSVYGLQDAEISLGYGYKNPVYVLVSDEREILLDYDSMEELYDLRKGGSRG